MGESRRIGDLSPYDIKRDMDNYELDSFSDSIILGDKSVKDRKKRREYRRNYEQQRKQKPLLETNLQKSSDMLKKAPKQASSVNNNENIKQAAFLKLATIKLAIQFIQRNRGMSKQAIPVGSFKDLPLTLDTGWNNPMGAYGSSASASSSNEIMLPNIPTSVNPSSSAATPKRVTTSLRSTPAGVGNLGAVPTGQGKATRSRVPLGPAAYSVNSAIGNTPQEAVDLATNQPIRSARTIRKDVGWGMTDGMRYKSDTGYNLGSLGAAASLDALDREQYRINTIWNSMNPDEQERYKEHYRRHIESIEQRRAEVEDSFQYENRTGWNSILDTTPEEPSASDVPSNSGTPTPATNIQWSPVRGGGAVAPPMNTNRLLRPGFTAITDPVPSPDNLPNPLGITDVEAPWENN